MIYLSGCLVELINAGQGEYFKGVGGDSNLK